ncbi:APC family permease [Ihubacter massiliensis]|uniref:APC family permease n=1 Tax=Hominibacterium faecale TaxID=2839743 RepID=A0A9J6QSC1_9FIRM|nr:MULTISPECIES: APC family permease [Eubacteriales Family XIII. Incertae Sedis]MCI7304381.1 APC family permease [Clostridia bacterium]MDE8733669.1 APC family permease [Eubacteriales bacterium DFI.9.88]MDY3011350.1 APC family permease [Clostridiales Family XIII bacterium]MCO7124058.1 APC family permease [Ihubacter massiliensis]MCU7379050.1 APC family permease [Hominibacterium faecale]
MNSIQNTTEKKQTLKRILKLRHLVFYGVAYILPLTIFTTYGLATTMSHGMISLCFVVTTTAMAFTAFSYSKMARSFPVAGSTYTYVSKSMNPYVGFISGWTILMGYMLLPMLTYLVMSIYLNQAVPAIPIPVWILILIFITAVVCYRGIEVAINVSSMIVLIQAVFIVALFIFMIRWLTGGNGAGTFFDLNCFFNFEEFNKAGMGVPMLFSTASILALSFLGFDAISTLSEEAIQPEKNVGKAIIITCIIMGLFFVLITYFLTLCWPNAWNELVDPDAGSYEFMTKVAGSTMAYVFTGTYTVGCFASVVNCQTSAARILYSMGRDGILPGKIFAHIHPKHKTPSYNAIIIAVISLVALFISLVTATSLVSFGALLGFTLVNLSVVVFYYVKKKERGLNAILSYLIAPLIGAGFTFFVWLGLDWHSKVLGFCWLGAGLIYLTIKTRFFRELPPEMSLDE